MKKALLMSNSGKSVLVISSHVIRGSVGTRVSVNALEQMGYAVWDMLTVSMTWQPRHGPSHRLIVPVADFKAWADDIIRSKWVGEIAAVMTGYFGSAEQIEITADLIKTLKQKNPHLVYFCDPVLGDEGGLYVGEDIAKETVEKLLPLADILKPNRSELEWIVSKKLDTNHEIIEAARKTGCKTTLVTSAWPLLKNATGNLLVTDKSILLAEHPLVKDPVNGLGDLTAALFLARILDGDNEEDALRFATASVYTMLMETTRNNGYELMLESGLHRLGTLAERVTLRYLKDTAEVAKNK